MAYIFEPEPDIELLDVFNDSEDSDIVIEFNDSKVFAHRVILRMWSPYFDRALKSKFAVAKSPVFHLDEDDDGEAVYAMLRHMYNMPYCKHSSNQPPLENVVDHHFEVFKVADKYDCPSLRHIAQNEFRNEARRLVSKGAIPVFTEYVILLCGPNASHLADPSLRDHLITICISNFGKLADDDVFQARLEAGKLFDAEASTKILASVGSRVQDSFQPRKRRRAIDPMTGLPRGHGLSKTADGQDDGVYGDNSPFGWA